MSCWFSANIFFVACFANSWMAFVVSFRVADLLAKSMPMPSIFRLLRSCDRAHLVVSQILSDLSKYSYLSRMDLSMPYCSLISLKRSFFSRVFMIFREEGLFSMAVTYLRFFFYFCYEKSFHWRSKLFRSFATKNHFTGVLSFFVALLRKILLSRCPVGRFLRSSLPVLRIACLAILLCRVLFSDHPGLFFLL